MSVALGVNIDHIATLRQARGAHCPDLLAAAKTAVSAGADLIVMHLRGDRRHIQEDDLFLLKKRTKIHLHPEMAATREMERIALELKPHSVCLVPEKPNELTTEGGLKITRERKKEIAQIIKNLKSKGISISLFLDPNPNDIRTAHALGANIVELCTKTYSEAIVKKHKLEELEKLSIAGVLVRELGMELHAGHGLDYDNVLAIAQMEGMECLNIGFAIMARAIFTGLEAAVRDMKKLINSKASVCAG
jgi:pyridoxine 5-phosphate synthase